MSETNWIPGLVVFAIGFVVGVLVLLFSKGLSSADQGEAKDSNSPEALEQRYQMLLGQLRELQSEKHHHAPDRFEAERSRLELQAAQILRVRDQKPEKTTKSKQAKTAATPSRMPPQLRGALWGGGLVLLLASLGFLLSREEKPREAEMAPNTQPATAEDGGF